MPLPIAILPPVGSTDDHGSDDEPGEGSEVDEFRFVQRLRAVRRADPTQSKLWPWHYTRDRFATNFGTHREWEDLFVAILRASTQVGRRDYERMYDERGFIEHFMFMSIDDRHFILDHGSPAIGGRSRWRLSEQLPDTDGDGWPISNEAFQRRWNGDVRLLLKRLIKKHEGEIAEVDGWWTPYTGTPPTTAVWQHPRFSLDRHQWLLGGLPSIGGSGNRVLKLGDNVLDGYDYECREAHVVTLPWLFREHGQAYTACQLYRFYRQCKLLAVKRKHAWAAPLRRAAAHWRYEHTGRYGFGG